MRIWLLMAEIVTWPATKVLAAGVRARNRTRDGDQLWVRRRLRSAELVERAAKRGFARLVRAAGRRQLFDRHDLALRAFAAKLDHNVDNRAGVLNGLAAR